MKRIEKILVAIVLVLCGCFVFAGETSEENYQKVFDVAYDKCARKRVPNPDIEMIRREADKLDNDAVPFLIKVLQGSYDRTIPLKPTKGPEIVKQIGKDNPIMKSVAAIFLGFLKDERAAEPLIEILKSDQAKTIITETAHTKNSGAEIFLESVIFAVGELGDNRAVEPLIMLYNNVIKKYKYEIINALGNLGTDNRAVVFLLDLFERENLFIFEALGRTKDPLAIEAIARVLDYDVLPEKYANKPRNAWGVAAVALAQANTPLALDKLSKIILDSTRPLEIRDRALRAIKFNPPSRGAAEQILLKAIDDENERIKYLAITSLGGCKEIDKNLVLSIAQKMVREGKGEGMSGALDVLEKLGDENTAKFLEEQIPERAKINPKTAESIQKYWLTRLKERLAKEKAGK